MINDEPIIRDVLSMTCGKRMALSRTATERDEELSKNYVYEQIKKVIDEANEMQLDWSLINITLQIWDSRYLRAISSEFIEKGEENGE